SGDLPRCFGRLIHTRSGGERRANREIDRTVYSNRCDALLGSLPPAPGRKAREGRIDRIGTKVGSIRIVRLLGSGGMGAVFLGYDERLNREVALKAIRRQRFDPAAKARFLREARALSQFDHPHICKIYEYLEDEGGG